MTNSHNFELVFRIRDILIRIRILGSVHWITDPDPALFGSVFKDGNNQKITFLGIFLLTVGTLISIMSIRSLRCIKPYGRIMVRKPFKNCKQYLFNNYSMLRIYKIKTEKKNISLLLEDRKALHWSCAQYTWTHKCKRDWTQVCHLYVGKMHNLNPNTSHNSIKSQPQLSS